MIKIAVDAMGGDFAPAAVVDGALLAAREHNVPILLVGREEEVKPLCRDDCRGLCPQCGTNLNTGTCDCSPVWEDPRLAALKAIKGKNA